MSVPYMPVITAPTAGAAIDAANVGVTFLWQHRSTQGSSQTAYSLRRRVGTGSYTYWTGTTWSSTATWNGASPATVFVPAAQWVNGQMYSYSIATQDAGGQGYFSADRTFIASAPPTATVTSPGASTTSSRPTVAWTYSDDYSQQGSAKVKVFTAAQYGAAGFDPATSTPFFYHGFVGSLPTYTLPVDLANATTYRVYVQVTDQTGQVSPWVYAQTTTSFVVPTTPALTATADNPNARVTLAYQGADNMLSADQASLEGALDHGSVVACTIARSSVTALNGTWSLRMTSTSTGTMSARTGTTPQVNPPVTPGQAYTGSVYIRSNANVRNIQAGIAWYDASGSPLGAVSLGGTVASVVGTYTRVSVTATAPANAAFGAVVAQVVNPGAAGEIHDADEFMLTPGSTLIPWTAGGFVPNATAVVEYSDDAGVTWTALRTSGAVVTPATQALTLYDYELVSSQARLYRARVLSLSSGVTVASANTANQSATLTLTVWWLKDPITPANNRSVWVTDDSGTDIGVDVAIHNPLPQPGETKTPAIPVYGAYRGYSGALTFIAKTQAERNALLTLLTARRTLLIQSPPDAAGETGEQTYVACHNAKVGRLVKGLSAYRTVAVQTTEVTPP